MRSTPLLAIAALFLVYPCASQTETRIVDQIRDELRDGLYPIENVVPGYRRPDERPPTLAVAEFSTSDVDLVSRSQAIAEILRYRTQYVPEVRLTMPDPFKTHADARTTDGPGRALLIDPDAFESLYRSLGTESVLTGAIDADGDVFMLKAELRSTASGEVEKQREWRFESDRWPETLIAVVEWSYRALGVELTARELDYIRDETSLSAEAMEDFVANFAGLQEEGGPLKRERLEELRQAHPRFVPFGVHALKNMEYADNLDEAYENLTWIESVSSHDRENAGLRLEAYRAMDKGVLPKHEIAAYLNGMKELTAKNPHDPSIMLDLGEGLVHAGSSLEGTTVLLEAVERWPDNYRAWWSLGWGLNRHAWHVRGPSMWQEVPDRAKKKFRTLSHLSSEVVDKALGLNDRNPGLWVMKLNSMGSERGFSTELIETFDSAVELAPTHRELYDNALHYSADQWGGNARARLHVIELAEKNNPDAAWPPEMRRAHESGFYGPVATGDAAYRAHDLKALMSDRSAVWIGIATVCVLLLFGLVFALGRRSARG